MTQISTSYLNITERLQLLDKLSNLVSAYIDDIHHALNKDLGRHAAESCIAETVVIQEEIKLFRKNLRRWLKPKKASTPISLFPSTSKIQLDPLGKVLIISPWNFPFHLSLVPAIGAIAAGNSVTIKPSEFAPHSSKLLAKIINEEIKSPFLKVVEGGIKDVKKLLTLKFDKIFFTGSVEKGKSVYKAAAKHLTPVTLELGGKNPLIVDKSANLKLIKRIVWGKFLNAGQTCLAPDYALVHKDILDSFTQQFTLQLKAFYGSKPLESDSLASIVNKLHFKRLNQILIDKSTQIIAGGSVNEQTLKIAPTLLKFNISEFDLEDEIFGPILPIISYQDDIEVLNFVKRYPNPLVSYAFTSRKSFIHILSSQSRTGAISFNDCLMHGANPNLPFGGVGSSGIGKYHGYHSLLSFSNQKTIFKKNAWGDIKLKFPPYTKSKLKWLKKLV